MTNSASTPPAVTWRYRLGVFCFVAAFAVYLTAPLALIGGASSATVTAITAANFALNKILLVAAAAILGKSGFGQLKQTAFGLVGRYSRPREVGPTRHTIGLVLFVVPILIGWISPYVGDTMPALNRLTPGAAMAGDIAFLFSLFVLGGNFWDKLRALFIKDAQVVFPEGLQQSRVTAAS